MCMAHSLELRVPFLDRKVMEFAEHIPDRYRINENGNKQVLRHAANKSLPDEWATRPKVGFTVPIVYWLREQKWYDYVKEYFTAPWASEFFDTDELMHLLDLHFAGKGDFQRKIYTPLVFLVWYNTYRRGPARCFRLPSLGLRTPARNGSSGSRFCVGAFQLL